MDAAASFWHKAAVVADGVVRAALRASAVFNLGGALLFGFPASLGWLAGLPGPVPRLYAAMVALFVLLFGGAYAWVASQPRIDRPIVAMAAVGKTGAFVVVVCCWLLGDVPARAVLAISGDLVFAAIFTWWLVGTPAPEALPATPGR